MAVSLPSFPFPPFFRPSFPSILLSLVTLLWSPGVSQQGVWPWKVLWFRGACCCCYRLRYLNTWLPVGDTIWEGLGGVCCLAGGTEHVTGGRLWELRALCCFQFTFSASHLRLKGSFRFQLPCLPLEGGPKEFSVDGEQTNRKGKGKTRARPHLPIYASNLWRIDLLVQIAWIIMFWHSNRKVTNIEVYVCVCVCVRARACRGMVCTWVCVCMCVVNGHVCACAGVCSACLCVCICVVHMCVCTCEWFSQLLVATCMRQCNDIPILPFSNNPQPVAGLLIFSYTAVPKPSVAGLWVWHTG